MTNRLPQNYIPTHYNLFLHIIKGKRSFDASVEITFQKNKDDDKLLLNISSKIFIKKIVQNNVILEFKVDSSKLIIFRSQNREIDFTTYPILIEYTVSLSYIKKFGLFSYHGNYFTDFEPDGARLLLPCFDEPCIRSSFSITLQIPSDLTAISNMPIETISNLGSEKAIIFQRTPPMCSYLLCICVGNFSSIEATTNSGKIIKFFTKNGEEDLFRDYLQVSLFSFEWLEANFGVQYELPQLQLISIDGFQNGMENYGLITLKNYSKGNFLKNATVIMHEIVHQWFGDLVSIKWWDSLWLNEGFAEFIQYLILNDYSSDSNAIEKYGENEGIFSFYYFEKGRIVPNENEIVMSRLFCPLVYVKGSFVMKMFYDLIGKENFFKICSNWLLRYKNESVEILDLVILVNNILDYDYSNFFNGWLRNIGFPFLIVSEIVSDSNPKKNVGINIAQCSPSNVCYHFNVEIMFEINGEIKREMLLIDNYNKRIDLEYEWIVVNNDISALCFVIYSNVLLEYLSKPKKEKKINRLNKMLINYSKMKYVAFQMKK